MMKNNANAAHYPRRKISGVVFDVDSFPIAVEMRDLYLECVSHLIRDEAFRLHTLMMPGRWGEHFVEVGGNDPELDAAIERLTGSRVESMDCIIVLGRDILSVRRNEDEMTEIVAADLSIFVNMAWSIADRSTGWVGSHLGMTAVLGMLTMAHPILRAGGDRIARLKDEVITAMAAKAGYTSAQDMSRENGPAAEAVGLVCDRVTATNGEYLSLPVRLIDLVDAGRGLLSRIIDDMVARPIGIV